MPTSATGEVFKEMVRQEWTDTETVRAWTKWVVPFSIQMGAVTKAIVERTDLQPGMSVLDLAS